MPRDRPRRSAGDPVRVCTPAPVLTTVVLVDRLVTGERIAPLDSLVVVGGDGVTVARAAAALDAPSVTVVLPAAGNGVPALPGRLQELAAGGVEVVTVASPDDPAVEMHVVERASGRTTVLRTQDTPCDRMTWRALADELRVTGPDEWSVLAGRTPPGSSPERWAECAAATPGPWAVCADAAAVTRLAGAGPSLVVVDAPVAAAVVGVAVDGVDSAVDAAVGVVQRSGGTGVAALVREAGDLVVAEPDGAVWRVTGEVPGPFTSSARAVCAAGLVAARELGASWPDAAAFAVGAVTVAAADPYPGRADAVAAGTAAAAVTVRRLRSAGA